LTAASAGRFRRRKGLLATRTQLAAIGSIYFAFSLSRFRVVFGG
jgi:hypothetical protein